jgi:large subunit ribosomal protein L10
MHPAKETIVEEIVGRLNASPFLFVADYAGLRVDQFSELRNRLHAVGAGFHVVKNTFLRRAVSSAGLPELADLKGQNAIVVGDKDVAAAAKVVKTFASEFKKPTLRAGIVDRLVVSAAQVDAIADLPSREVLLATFLGVLQAPASKLVRVLNEPAASLARVLQAKVDQASGAASVA